MRSPLHGFNHNVRHNGLLLHVQTEDSGVKRPHLITHVFHEGAILSTTRSTYLPETADEQVRSQMQEQHKTVLKQIRKGELDKTLLVKIPGFLSTQSHQAPMAAMPASQFVFKFVRKAQPEYAYKVELISLGRSNPQPIPLAVRRVKSFVRADQGE